MALELTRDDYELLKQVLERYVSNLRMEIAGTENADWRKAMHADEDRAKAILAQLAGAPAEDEGGEDLTIVFRGYVVRV